MYVEFKAINCFGRSVLITPLAITGVYPDSKCVAVSLTKEQVKNSPDTDTDRPISRRIENELFVYYDFPVYWGGAGLWGAHSTPAGALAEHTTDEEPTASSDSGNESKLRSCNEVTGYHVHAVDGEVGKVRDFWFEYETWRLRYLQIELTKSEKSRQILVSTKSVDQVIWAASSVQMNHSTEKFRFAPVYSPGSTITRDLEHDICNHFELHRYWERPPEL
ncbi:MAG: PRC-barrel domain-containing protein [Spirochaeta sp.]|nr:PRC-barrel domain-containing protein [Spirochaeta sp.]